MNMLIKDMANTEKPYEKALQYGVSVLNDAELLALVMRTGTKETSVIDLAQKVLNVHPIYKGINSLNYVTTKDLTTINGIGQVKAIQILAITELANRLKLLSLKENIRFQNPDSIARYYQEKCKCFTTEKTFLMLLNNAYTLIKDIQLSEGTVNQALISPREIFIEALRYQAVHLILVHNHPSGYPEPSSADILVTKKIKEAGELLDIHLSDHIIVAGCEYVSLLERGIL